MPYYIRILPFIINLRLMKKIIAFLTATILFLASCQKDELITKKIPKLDFESSLNSIKIKEYLTYYGQSIPIGEGFVRTYVRMKDNTTPLDIGVEFSKTAIKTLPMEMDASIDHENHNHPYNLEIPYQAKNYFSFNHISIDWAMVGHGPTGVYDKPHFDIHFYLISENQQMSIINDFAYPTAPSEAFTFIGPSTVPTSYFPGPFVEMMGTHWISKSAPELFSGAPFTSSFIYGTHNNEIAFIEPMVTLETLSSKKESHLPIAQPSEYIGYNKFFPTQYGIYYNNTNQSYTVALENLIKP